MKVPAYKFEEMRAVCTSLINSKGKAKGVVPWKGKEYIITGIDYADETVEAYQVVPLEKYSWEFKDEQKPLGIHGQKRAMLERKRKDYSGLKVRVNKREGGFKEYVCIRHAKF